MLNRKKIMVVSMIILAILMISAVSATEENTTLDTLTADEVTEDSIQTTLDEVETIESTVGDDEIIAENYDEMLTDKISDVEINVTLPENMKAGETYTIDVKMPEDVSSEYIDVYYDDADDYFVYIEIWGGNGQFDFTPTEFGSHTLRLNYYGNDVYESRNVYLPVEINDYTLNFGNDYYYYKNSVSLTVPNTFSGSVNVTVNGKQYVLNPENDYSFIPENVSLGVNEASIHYDGDDTFHALDTTATFEIHAKIKVDVEDEDSERWYYGNKIYLEVPSDVTGNLVLYATDWDEGITKKVNSTEIVKGYAELPTPSIFGYYDLSARYEGDYSEYIHSAWAEYFHSPNVIIPTFQEYGSTSKIVVAEKGINGNLTAYLVEYDENDNQVRTEIGNASIIDGDATIIIPSLDSGRYQIVTELEIDGYSRSYFDNFVVGNVSMTLDIINGSNYTRLDYFKIIFENTVSGNLNILFDDKNGFDYEMYLDDEYDVYFDLLSGGAHNVTVTFTTPNNHKFTQNATFNIHIPEFDMNLSVENDSIYSYELELVRVYFNDYVTGVVSYYVDGDLIDSFDVDNGRSQGYYIEYSTIGNHTLKVVFIDENETEHSKEVAFKIIPRITAPRMIFPNDDSAFIYMGKYDGLIGNLTAYVIEEFYNETSEHWETILREFGYSNFVDGEAKISLSKLNSSANVGVIYAEGNHTCYEDVYISVFDMDLSVKNNTVIESLDYINVNFPTSVSGSLTYYIDGEKIDQTNLYSDWGYYFNLDSSYTTAGSHTLKVVYSNDDGVEYSKEVNFKILPDMVIPTLVALNDDSVIYLGKDDSLKGNLTAYIKKETWNESTSQWDVTLEEFGYSEFENGEASIPLSNLDVGSYSIKVVYAEGNYTYEQDRYITIFDMALSVENNSNITYLDSFYVTFTTSVSGSLNYYIDDNFINQINLYYDTSIYVDVDQDYSEEGNHTLKVTYTNDDGFEYSKNVTFNIAPVIIDIPHFISKNNGGTHYATVTVAPGATGIITVKVDGEELPNSYDVYDYQTEYYINLDGLDEGKYDVEIIYSGNYPETSKTETVTVGYVAQLEYHTYYYGSDNQVTAVVPYDINKENVIVKIDGNVHDWTNNGNYIYIDRTDMNIGKHNITVEYSADGENFTTLIDDEFYIISHIEMDWSYNYITLILPENATGKLLINISEYDHEAGEFKDIISEEVSFNDGKAIYYLSKLHAGVYYRIHAEYDGDDYQVSDLDFNPEWSSIFTIDKQVLYSNESVTVSYSTVDNYGYDFVINIYYEGSLVNSTTVSLDENNYAEYTFSNLKYGKYQFELMYGYSSWYDVEVLALDSNLNINVSDINEGETAKVNVTLPEDATGNITVLIDGAEKYSGPIKDIDLENLTAGAHAIEVKFSGDDKYAPANIVKAFIVNEVIPEPVDSEANITIPSEATTDETPKVNVQLPEDATGNITVIVDGETVYNGPITYEISLDDLAVGAHAVEVKYSGDDKYATTSKVQAVLVSEPAVVPVKPTVKANSTPVTEGETAVIDIAVDSDATGLVLAEINGNKYYSEIKDGKATISAVGLNAGNYTAVITYLGDDKYTNASATANVKVNAKPVTPEPADAEAEISIPDEIKAGENTNIAVSLPEDATGNITVLVDGKEIANVAATESANIPLNDLTAGNHNVEVKYSGDDKYAPASETKEITVSKVTTTITAQAKEISEGETLIITVNVNTENTKTTLRLLKAEDNTASKATGIVLVKINGDKYYADVINGVATVTINNLKAGKYNADITYLGDDKYNASATIAPITVKAVETPAKEDANASVDVPSSAESGETPAASVTLPKDATGNVSVLVDGKEVANVPVVNGTASVPLENLSNGAHVVEVKYSGDDKYAPAESTSAIAVTEPTVTPEPVEKTEANIGLNVPSEVLTNETPTATATLPKDATGNVSILVDGKEVAKVTAKENINVVLDNLAAGAHAVEIKYSGDDKYAPASTAKAILISEPKVTPTPEPSKEDANTKVDLPSSAESGETPAATVSLPKDATGNVSVLVDGKEVANVPVVNGTASVPLANLTAGAHLVEVKYSGDDKYAPSNTPKAIVVNDKVAPAPAKTKIDTLLSANATLERVANEHTKTGENGTDYYVTLTDVNGNKLVNKTVQIAINGVHYYVQTDSDGRAHQTVSMESANVYTYAFAFQGDDDYNAAPLNSTRLTVTKKATTITAKAVSFKKSAKTKKVTVTFSTVINDDGNMYLAKGKQLTLKVNGKTYKAKTNANNKATFSIKLTKKGKFNAKIAFAGSKIYAASSKTIKITIK